MRRGIIVLKADDRYPDDPSLYEVVDINRSVKDLMGKSNEKLVGRKITEIILLKETDLKMLSDVVTTGNSQQMEYYVKRLDEWLSISIHHSQNDFLTVIFENIPPKNPT